MVPIALLLCSLGAPSTSSLVQAYDDSIRRFAKVECRIRFRNVYQGQQLLNGKVTREGTYLIRRDGDRAKITLEGTVRYPEKGRIVEDLAAFDKVVNQQRQYIEANQNGKERKLKYVVAFLEGAPEGKGLEFADSFTALFGFLPGVGVRPFIDVLRKSTLEVHADDSLGRPAWRLDAVGSYGRASIWCDPQFGLRVCRLVKSATGDDLVNGVKVSDLPAMRASPWRPSGKIQALETIVDISEFGKWDDFYFPAAATVTETEIYADGQRMSQRFEMQIDQFRYAPGFGPEAFDITAPIPNGYAVQVDDHRNVSYEWRNGQIAKVVDAETERNLASSSFASAFSGAGYFVFFAVSLLAVVIVGAWAYKRATA